MNKGDEKIRVLAMGKWRGIKMIGDQDFMKGVAVDKSVVEMMTFLFLFI